MIKKMRLKFIFTAMGALLILLFSIFLTINLFMKQVTSKEVDNYLTNIINNRGKIENPKKKSKDLNAPAPPIKGFAFTMSSNSENIDIIFIDENITKEELYEYGKEALNMNVNVGKIGDYSFKMVKDNDSYLFAFANTSVQNDMLSRLLKISYLTSGISIILLFIVIIILSGFITKPVETAFEKQKRFIADSSHELKTPLSVISANLDILKMEIGENSRINEMSKGIKRMNGLIHDLLILARTEQGKKLFKPVDLSKVMESTILSLEVVAYEHGNEIVTNIENNIIINGNEEDLRKMIEALMENAIKYSKKGTAIKADLYKKGDNRIIEIYNEGIGVTKEQKEKLFDKFYRVDNSRQRKTGGYGIGLSIVKSVVEKHGGKIHVDSVPNEYILFKITLHK